MPYLIDRQRAFYERDLVVLLNVHQRRVRSRVILNDNSLHQTLSRVQTLVRRSQTPIIATINRPRQRTSSRKGALWRKQP